MPARLVNVAALVEIDNLDQRLPELRDLNKTPTQEWRLRDGVIESRPDSNSEWKQFTAPEPAPPVFPPDGWREMPDIPANHPQRDGQGNLINADRFMFQMVDGVRKLAHRIGPPA